RAVCSADTTRRRYAAEEMPRSARLFDGSAVEYGQLRWPRLELLRNPTYRNSLREFLGLTRELGASPFGTRPN
ncbi:hypothetical protein ACIGMX_46395, partial [Streptomyces aquilus]|uniref:hypothetical protein n=1 Tax=Streptomyces aquilus TaxID=2548456 RepID=UPI0037CE4DED